MGTQPMEISGITPVSHFPKCPPHHPCTQFCESDKLCIPYQKITKDNLREVCFRVCVNSFKIICTPAGKKLVVDGTKQIKIFFVPDGSHQTVHSADFEIPFCAFVLLKDLCDEVVDICSVVEDVTIKFQHCNFFTITSIIFICPVFRKGNQLCPPSPKPITDYPPPGTPAMNPFDCHDKQQCSCHTPCPPHDHHNHCENHQQHYQSHPYQSLCKNYQFQSYQ